MQSKKFKFVIVGGGTAGMMAAAYLYSYWRDKVDIEVVYDYKNPGIGVGESLTPIFVSFLNDIGVTVEEVIKNCNATFKLGLKFKNWTGDNSYYYHPFTQTTNSSDDFNFTLSSSIVNNKHKLFSNEEYIFYDSFYFENNCLPIEEGKVVGKHALHIDATLFSKFLEEKLKDKITISNNVVVAVSKDYKSHVRHLICQDGKKIDGDFFIDASGFQRVLFNHLEGSWVDMKHWLPLDRCIPNPVFYEFDKQPTYTTSEATEDGWILQVPLQNRWGTGYLYSSEFLDDETAFVKFSSFVEKRYGKQLNNTSRVITFDSGYFEKPWVGNCLSIGLSYGFSEPLEATNIHQIVQQLGYFVNVFNMDVNDYDINKFNKVFDSIFKNIYTYLRFCYSGRRYDSRFWKSISYNEPDEIYHLRKKISSEIVNTYNLNDSAVFNYHNFTLVANGLKLIDKRAYKNILESRSVMQNSIFNNISFKQHKLALQQNSVDHKSFINEILTVA